MSVRRTRRRPTQSSPKELRLHARRTWPGPKSRSPRYPAGRQPSAVIPLLWRAQEQPTAGCRSRRSRYVADMLGMPYIRVLEVATFYTMFQLEPVGTKAHVQVCGTTPCMLRGAERLIEVCQQRIGHEPLHVSADGNFSWDEVECLGACVNAPMVQIATTPTRT